MDADAPRGDYFGDDYVQTDTATGVARDRAGTRLVGLPEDFLAAVRQTLEVECGPTAEPVAHAASRDWGRGLAERLSAELTEYRGEPLAAASVAQFQADLQSAFRQLGWGILTLDLSRYETGMLVAEIRHAPADGLALLAGALAGLLSHFAGRELAAVTTSRDPAQFVIALPERLEKIAEALHGSHDEIVTALQSVRV